jgi:dienelactone hydrolase
MNRGLLIKHLLAVILIFTLGTEVQAKLITKTVEYKDDGMVCKGYLAYDDAIRGKRPGILVVHEFYGLNDFAKKKAEELAGLGYVAFAADMYGKGYVTTERQDASKHAAELRNAPPLLRARAQAALKVLADNPQVDPKRLAAVGFCFGGTTVLELAYSGADLKGVVSFHGGLLKPKVEEVKGAKAAILVLHGADDPHVKAEEVAAFQEGMRQGGADWQMVFFGGTVHSFMNPEAGSDKASGVAYEPRTAKRAWQYMKDFFKEIFAVKGRD